MRKHIWLLLLSVLVLFSACGNEKTPSLSQMEQPVRFYYPMVNEQSEQYYDRPDGALSWEWCDLGPNQLSFQEILNRYLEGPTSVDLTSPMPEGVELITVLQEEEVLCLTFSEELQALMGIDRTIASACLLRTMTQFPGIKSIRLLVRVQGTDLIWSEELTEADFLLEDDTGISDASTVRLYFGSSSGRYLRLETREQITMEEDELPHYVLDQLLTGPMTEPNRSVYSGDLSVLQVSVEEGLCTVDLSQAFLSEQPETHKLARLAVFSLVNSLTELPQIKQVLLLCEGQSISDYQGLDLSEPLTPDASIVDLKPDQNRSYEDVTLYLPCAKPDLLAAVPVMIQRSSGRTLAQEVLDALIAFPSQNGYQNPIPPGTIVQAVEQQGNLCRVSLGGAFSSCGEDSRQAVQAVRMITASLCGLAGVERVQIVVQDAQFTSVDLSTPLFDETSWLLE